MATSPIQSLLNPSLGIQELMQMPEAGKLPEIRDLANSVLNETSLEGLYGAVNSRSAAEALLCPSVGDGTLVSPEVFHSQLKALVDKLQHSENPKVQELLKQEIYPVLQNGLLLSAYRGLMLGG